ncbi:MAG TPA: FAD-binding oxidoreductase [Terriglobales bacterium]|nr:FAD-binding oxidoreductase [Terriglobales bacterium]
MNCSDSPRSRRVQDASRRRFFKMAALAGGGALIGAAGLNEAFPKVWPEPMAFESNPSFWARCQPSQNSPLRDDVTVDVAIIGGGFTGLSSAYYIRTLSPHRRVIVLEAKGCGNGASGRNGAMVLTMTADRYMKFGSAPAMDKKIYDLTVTNIGRLSNLSAATGIDCELETNGALQLLNTDEDIRAAKTYVRQARLLGMPVEFWEQQQLVNAIGTDVYAGAFFDPNGGHIHPMKLVHVLKAAAEGVGAEIYENTIVMNIREGSEHVLHTSEGYSVKARSLVLATNAFTSRLGYLRNSILPVREYVAMTRPLSEQQLAEIGWQKRVPFNDSRTEVYYLGLTQDNRIHIGGGSPSYRFNSGPDDPGAGASHFSQLRRELIRLYPKLDGVEFELGWNGVVDWSLDASPSVGRTGRHNNIFYGIGYSGHGVNLSSVFGSIIADLEAGREDRWKDYPFVNASLDYIPNEPLRWLAAQSGLAWYRITGS